MFFFSDKRIEFVTCWEEANSGYNSTRKFNVFSFIKNNGEKTYFMFDYHSADDANSPFCHLIEVKPVEIIHIEYQPV